MNDYICYLDSNKHLVGLEGWKIKVATEFKEIEGGLAEVDCDINKKELKVVFDKSFPEKTPEEQAAIMIHELIHARVNIAELQKEELRSSIEERIEEELVNDLERGMMVLISNN